MVFPRQENRSFLLQLRDRTITENGHSGTAWTGLPRTGIIRIRLLHSDLYIRVYSAVFNIIRKCFTKELSNDEEGKKLCSELCRFFMTNGPIMGHDVFVIGTKVR